MEPVEDPAKHVDTVVMPVCPPDLGCVPCCRHPVLQEPLDVSLVELKDMEGGRASVAVVETAQGTKHLLVQQVHSVLLHGSLHRNAWQRTLQRAAGRVNHPFKQPSPLLRSKLVKLGAVKNKNPKPLLISLALAIKAAKATDMPAALVDSMTALHANHGVTLAQASTSMMQQNAMGSTRPQSLLFATELPQTVDTSVAPTLRVRERVSLEVISPSLANSPVLNMQLQRLKDHCKLPIVMGRKGGPVNSVTWEEIHKQCMLFLGYIHSKFGVLHPNLEHFTRADFVAAYCASKGKRGDKGITICKATSVARRVVLFWKTRCPAEVHKLSELHDWLGQLSVQVRQAWPSQKRNVGHMAQLGTWAEASKIVAILVRKKAEVEHKFQDKSSLLLAEARELHDVALACTMFGWIPPPRSACIRSLCTTWHRGPCPDADCQAGDCWGNKLYVLSTGQLKMHLPHHKSAKVWGPIEFELPEDLAALLVLYLTKGHKVLKQDLQVEHPFVFMSTTGQALRTDTLCLHWKACMAQWEGPAVSPHRLRHIFVDERMQTNKTPGPSQRGAAYCMGHDAKQWGQSYDLQSLQRQGQEAINNMCEWRSALLASEGVSQPLSPNAGADDHALDALMHGGGSIDASVSGSQQSSWQSGTTTEASQDSSEVLGSSSGKASNDVSDEDDDQNLMIELSDDE